MRAKWRGAGRQLTRRRSGYVIADDAAKMAGRHRLGEQRYARREREMSGRISWPKCSGSIAGSAGLAFRKPSRTPSMGRAPTTGSWTTPASRRTFPPRASAISTGASGDASTSPGCQTRMRTSAQPASAYAAAPTCPAHHGAAIKRPKASCLACPSRAHCAPSGAERSLHRSWALELVEAAQGRLARQLGT